MKNFLDEATVTFTGGHGGAGIISFGKMAKSGPDGGNGGDGGDIHLVATPDITLLSQFNVSDLVEAHNGQPGQKNKKSGKKGQDKTIYLPIGTTLTEIETIHPNGLTTSGEIIDLDDVGQNIVISTGGRGGKGNWEFRSSRNTTPTFAQSGLPGQKRIFHINLRLIADIGFIGLPNAGKSSLLNALTNAKAKVASYAFTTLTPNLGVFDGRVLADIPGLIEGAHTGRGLGDKFLKHIEKVSVIFHCVASDSPDVVADYKTIREELKSFNKDLTKKEEIVLLTKVDLVDDKERAELLKKLGKINKNVYPVSLFDEELVESLKKIIQTQLRKV